MKNDLTPNANIEITYALSVVDNFMKDNGLTGTLEALQQMEAAFADLFPFQKKALRLVKSEGAVFFSAPEPAPTPAPKVKAAPAAKQERGITPNKRMLIDAIRAHAVQNYETGGWDAVVEAWNDAQILEVIGESFQPGGAIKKVAKVLKANAAYAAEIINA